MPRKKRELSLSNIYHIIFRGNDKQDIFYDNQDREIFLDRIIESKKSFNYEIFSYCLMSNHVHIVVKVNDDLLSKSMQSLGIRYSVYFNKKYDRRGHLFENRFVSKKIENLDYFLKVCKYVHRNPENANIEKTEGYKWSSFNEYNKRDYKIVNPKILLSYFNNNENDLIDFTLNDDKNIYLNNYADYELTGKLNENEIMGIIKEKFHLMNASDISLLGRKEQEKIIKEIKDINGIYLNQIARITKISRYRINKIWSKI